MNSVVFMRIAICITSMPTLYAHAEFLYPIASYTNAVNQHQLLVLHQKTVTTMQLWSWDPTTHIATQLLPAASVPAGVTLLPDNTGFSFIDNGRIRIKEFIKRSARSVDMPYAIGNSGPIMWHTADSGYFHALHHRQYALFSITRWGDVAPYSMHATKDCMYPSCINGINASLFYIQRTVHNGHCSYAIVEQALDTANSDAHICVDFEQRPLIFLTMISAHQGFVLEHPAQIDVQAPTITLFYHQLKRCNAQWRTTCLFSFSIPAHFIDAASDNRLHESIIPLVPRVVGSTIYYVDYTGKPSGQVCSYNVITGQQQVHTEFSCESPLVPVWSNGMLFCGGRLISAAQTDRKTCSLYTDSYNNTCFFFPSLSVEKESIEETIA